VTPLAWITFALVAGVVWGGFLLLLGRALAAEARKRREPPR
jgi:hypothetical protein